MESLVFEKITKSIEAAQLIMRWRNDYQTRSNSFTQKERTWPEYYTEFESRYFSNDCLPCYFMVLNSKRVGVLFFQKADSVNELNTAKISINIAPENRTRGLGTAALKAIIPTVLEFGIECLVAEILESNARSLKAFSKAGYNCLREYDRNLIEAINGQSIARVKVLFLELTEKSSRDKKNV